MGIACCCFDAPAAQTSDDVNVASWKGDQSDNLTEWRCVPADFIPIEIRGLPDVDGPRTGQLLNFGDVFSVSQEYIGGNGIHYLKLSDGRGWVYVSRPGVGCLCKVNSTVVDVAEERVSGATWRCSPSDGQPLEIRNGPSATGAINGFFSPGDLFRVSQEHEAENGLTYLKLEDGRGWVLVAQRGVGIFAEPELWRCEPADGKHIDVRAVPQLAGPITGHVLAPEEVFCVSKVYQNPDGITYLKLADGRGWVFTSKPDAGQLCVPLTVPQIAAGKLDDKIMGQQQDPVPHLDDADQQQRVAEEPGTKQLDEEEERRSIEEARQLETERRARMEDEFQAELARMSEQVSEWQQRAELECKAKEEAELRVLSERRAKEDAMDRAEIERAAMAHDMDSAEQQLREEAEHRAQEEAGRFAEVEQRALLEAERCAEVERNVLAQAKDAEEREKRMKAEAEQRAEVERMARLEAERREESERLAALQAKKEVERLSNCQAIAEAERLAAWRKVEADRIVDEEQKGREKEDHRALVVRLAGEVCEWQRRAEDEHRAKQDADKRVETERIAKEDAERRAESERLAGARAKDETERKFRFEAQIKAREEADRLAEAEIKAREEAERFAEVERLAAMRAMEAAKRQFRVQSERMSFDPGVIPQPTLVTLKDERYSDPRANAAIMNAGQPRAPSQVQDNIMSTEQLRAALVLKEEEEAERRVSVDRLAATYLKEAHERHQLAEAQKRASVV